MEQTISPAVFENVFAPSVHIEKSRNVKSMRRFIDWCDQQEKNRLLWLGIAIMGHIGMVLPLTLLSILFLADNNFALWIVVLCVNMPVLALNLAAQPPKVTLPVMFTSLFIDIVVVILSSVMFLR